MLYRDGTLNLDVNLKRCSFIGKFHELRQELKSQNPIVFMNLIIVYMSHFYGSNLWNLFDIENICVAWNNIVRNVFNLPRMSHRYLIEPLSGFPHVMTMLTNRFLKFYDTLYFSPKEVISNLRRLQENDCRSSFGSNIRNISMLNNNCDIRQCVKNSVKYFPVSVEAAWRIGLLHELLNLDFPGLSFGEIAVLKEFLACA